MDLATRKLMKARKHLTMELSTSLKNIEMEISYISKNLQGMMNQKYNLTSLRKKCLERYFFLSIKF